MIENSALGSIMGAPAVGPDGDKVGTVGQVFIEPKTGAPNWATVHTGLFGRHETFVPLGQATFDRETLHLPYGKDLVKDAPRIDASEPLTPDAEAELYQYYGVTPDVPDTSPVTSDSGDGPTAADRPLDSREPIDTAESVERHQDPDAEAAGAEYSRQSRLQQGGASDTTESSDAGEHSDAAAERHDGPKHRA